MKSSSIKRKRKLGMTVYVAEAAMTDGTTYLSTFMSDRAALSYILRVVREHKKVYADEC